MPLAPAMLVWTLLGCRGGDGDGPLPESPAPIDTADTADPRIEALEGVEEVWRDPGPLLPWGYEVVRFEVTEGYASLHADARPTFFVLRPRDLADDEALPLVVFHHGGAIGDDSVETPYPCQLANTDEWLSRHLDGTSGLALGAAARRHLVLIPRNDWCDGWLGLGPQDPVDPEHHLGLVHYHRALDFVMAGGAGARVARVSAWGTSAGGVAALSSALRRGGFDALIWDSGVASWITYFEQIGQDLGSSEAELRHVLGDVPWDAEGQRTAAWSRYEGSSPPHLLGLGAPPRVALLHNGQDLAVTARHAEVLGEALTQHLAPGDAFTHDLDHAWPGNLHHVQSVYAMPPMGSFAWAMFSFLEGDALVVQEAEDGCAEAECAGQRLDNLHPQGFSRGSGRQLSAGERGLLYEGPAPEGLDEGAPLRLRPALTAHGGEGLDEAADALLMQVLREDEVVAERSFTKGDLALDGGPEAWVRQHEALTLTTTAEDPGALRVRLISAGALTLRLDALIWEIGPPP